MKHLHPFCLPLFSIASTSTEPSPVRFGGCSMPRSCSDIGVNNLGSSNGRVLSKFASCKNSPPGSRCSFSNKRLCTVSISSAVGGLGKVTKGKPVVGWSEISRCGTHNFGINLPNTQFPRKTSFTSQCSSISSSVV